MTKSSSVRLLLLLALAVVVGLIVANPDWLQRELHGFLQWVQSLGWWGPVVLAAAYTPACLFFVPGSLLSLAAGFAFGVVVGTVTVSLGSVIGASAAFFAGRFLLRGWIEEKVARHPRFRAIDQAVGEQGFKIVLLTRLSPVFPFNLLNYAYGLTRVRFRHYLLASWIGMLPGTIMYVYLGSLVQNLADLVAGRVERSTGQTVLFVVGLVATVGVTIVITRIARKALDRAIAVDHNEPADLQPSETP
jgi:uncharacterized membrane protein YdjX (TVP38/TMEM64 family)